MTLESFELIRVLILASVAFAIAITWTPLLMKLLVHFRAGKSIRSKEETPIFAGLHAKKAGTPTMGGVLVWGTVLFLTLCLFYASQLVEADHILTKLNFLTRPQTLLPLGVLVATAIVGFLDDYLNIRRIGAGGGGLRMRHRLLLYTLIAFVGAWWFRVKLDWDMVHVPFLGDFNLGFWYLPLFLLVIVSTAFSVNETDGLDGLAGGTLMTSFGAYAVIAFALGKYDLAVFCGVILGALLAFLWFNIYPARFIMGDTGAMSLGVTLGVVAMLTNAPFILPIVGCVFVLESFSVLLQMFWKRVLHRKLFLSAPFHHHLEAIGWPEPKIVMRLWVISMVCAALGVAIALLDALVL